MEPRLREKYEAEAQVIKALAHPTRLFIVDMISESPHCVCEITEQVGADISTVSKHLSVLKEAGIVRDEKRGTMVYYHLLTPCVLDFRRCVRGVLQSRVDRAIRLVG